MVVSNGSEQGHGRPVGRGSRDAFPAIQTTGGFERGQGFGAVQVTDDHCPQCCDACMFEEAALRARLEHAGIGRGTREAIDGTTVPRGSPEHDGKVTSEQVR